MLFEYVMATIQIPIKVYENNTTEPMPEYMKLTISECSELPCKLTSSNSHNELMDQIKSIVSFNNNTLCEEPTEILTVSKEELEDKVKKARPKNITFRNKSSYRTRTSKQYSED
jgi:hypothetical protein|tara:strand:+ start:111 stop:452 length:342 start_codon:yes stop_codon:yes gene_type:complete